MEGIESNSENSSTSSSLSKNTIPVIGIIIALIIIGGVIAVKSMKTSPIEPIVTNTETVNTQTQTPTENIKEFSLEASNYKFDTTEIKVNKGDTVKIKLIIAEGNHDWVIDEFNVKTKTLKAGEEDSVTFVADKVGTFEYYCSVMQHRKMGMVGKLVVE